MSKEKEEFKALMDSLPDDVTLEEIQYQLYVLAKIKKGLKDIEENNILTHNEVKNILTSRFSLL